MIKKIINGISIITLILFGLWFLNDRSYEPLIGLLLSIAGLISTFFIDKKKKIKKFIYTINIRGLTEKELKNFMNYVTTDFFEISSYRIPKKRGEWKNILIETKTKINHKDLYNYFREKAGGKTYYVEGEGKFFGLNNDEGPAEYN